LSLKEVRARIEREVFQRGTPRALDVKLGTLTRKKVTGEMRIGSRHMNRSGRVNGGAIMAFADVLGAMGTVANLPPGHHTTTLESKTNFFAAGEPPLLKAVSVPLHIGRTTMVWQTTISNPDGRKVAIVTQTQIVIPSRKSASSGSAQSVPEKSRNRRKQ
jgi:1,4-dihydroxy-2-naphthoyl-CoA hydrolase